MEEDSPPFSIYSELGGLPQDPCCDGESSLEAEKGAGGGVQSAGSVYRRREALCIQVTSGLPQLRRTNSSRRQTPQTVTHIDIGDDDVIPLATTAFNLPEHLVAKADPALIAGDELHLAAIAESLEQQIADLSERLDAQRKAPGGTGRKALDRDLEIHRLTARLRLLRRFGLDLCLGRMVYTDSPEPAYIGRIGLTDSTGRRLLIDWRAPAAEPFFAATHANPMGLTSRRRYRWTGGRISD